MQVPDLDLNEWKALGPGGGGAQYRPMISPHDPNTVIVNCDMTGAYITHDGGESWRMFNLRSVVASRAYDPSDPNVIYVGSTGVFRSEDAGDSWQLVFPDPSKVTGEQMRGDHAMHAFQSEDNYPGGSVLALSVDPSNSNLLYAGIGERGRDAGASALFASADRGATWEEHLALGEHRIHEIATDPTSPEADRTVFVLTDRGTWVRQGGQWAYAGGLPDNEDVASAAIGFGEKGTVLYAVTPASRGDGGTGKLYRSADAGASWRALTPTDDRYKTEGPLRLQAVACSTGAPEICYLAVGIDGVEGVRAGVAKSEDGGETVRFLVDGDLEEGWLTPYNWGGQPTHLEVAAGDPDICYAVDFGKTYKTEDGGETWHQLYCDAFDEKTWVSRGLDVTTCYGVHFDPFVKDRVFISYTDIGLFRSRNGGVSWESVCFNGIPEKWTNTCYWMAFDPEVEGRMWSVWSDGHDLPRPKMMHERFPEFSGGVAVSEDGGWSWKPSTAGIPECPVTDILLDPTSPKEARILYACGFGDGVFRSEDGGQTWQLKNVGIEGNLNVWRMVRATDATLYVVVARGREGRQTIDGALYRSTDAGETWEAMELPEGVNGPNDLTICPENNSRLYLSVWAREDTEEETDGGVYRSEDGGGTWEHVLDWPQHVYDVTVDADHTERLYAGSFEGAVMRSDDRGSSWRRLRGYTFKWGHRVAVDPYREGMIFVTTFGGSLWHGPNDGDPEASEDLRPIENLLTS